MKKEIAKGNMIGWFALFCSLMGLLVFGIVAGLFYKLYSFAGFLSAPSEALVLANVLAIVGVVGSIYALVRKSSKNIAVAALVIGFFVLALPYILGFLS